MTPKGSESLGNATSDLEGSESLGNATSDLANRVEKRFGVLPNFFRLAPETPEIIEKLWAFAQAAYLDNPLPPVFKERLFVHLSRFCAVRYCIARHVGFLVGLGHPAGDPTVRTQSVTDVVKLLKRPFPRGQELQSCLSLCAACPAPLVDIPMSDTQMEDAVFVLAGHVFLKTSDYLLCLDALARLFGPVRLQYLLLFLAFVRAAHYWTETHPEIAFEDDIQNLLATHEALAGCILNDPEATDSVSQSLLDELPALRLKADKAIGLLAAIVDSSEDAIVSKTLEGIITSWNASAEQLFRYTASEAVGQHVSLIIPDDRRDEETVIIERIKKGERIEHFDTLGIRKDKTVLDISLTLSPVRDASGKIIGASTIARDISQRKRMERELRESEERYRALADALDTQVQLRTQELQSREELLRIFVKSVPVGVAMFDRDMRYLQASDRWCADYGLDSSQILGRSHYELFPDTPTQWKIAHRRALDAGEILHADEDRWDRESGPMWVRWETRPWKTSSGAVGGILIFAEDITARKKSEQVLADVPRKLIEAHEEERAWIARELHDDISQQIALLSVDLDQWTVPDGALEENVIRAKRRLEEISTEVQNLSHRLHSSKLDYLGLRIAAKGFCEELSGKAGVEVDFQYSDVPTTIPRELSLCLFRVLQESLQNAVKHSGVRSFDVKLVGMPDAIELTVSDNGSGFNVQEAFLNSGLGLVSMRERIQIIRGEMEIRSSPGAGTTICARVPWCREEQAIAG